MSDLKELLYCEENPTFPLRKLVLTASYIYYHLQTCICFAFASEIKTPRIIWIHVHGYGIKRLLVVSMISMIRASQSLWDERTGCNHRWPRGRYLRIITGAFSNPKSVETNLLKTGLLLVYLSKKKVLKDDNHNNPKQNVEMLRVLCGNLDGPSVSWC